MASHDYYATYCRFSAHTKDEAGVLLGADCCVGDALDVHADAHATPPAAWLENRFGACVGHLDADMAHQVLLAQARGWVVRVLLVATYYTEPATDEQKAAGPGHWGEVALVCFSDEPALRTFCDTLAAAFAEGARPAVDLGQSGVERLREAGGKWLPEARVAKPVLPAGTAVVKDHLTFNEKMVEQARRRNPGCMAAGWLFVVVALALVVWLAMRLLG